MSIKPGEEWGRPVSGPPDLDVGGDDAELAGWAGRHPGARIRFRPTVASDVARSVGLDVGREPQVELAMDLLMWDDTAVANMVVAGVPPDRLRRWSRAPHFEVSVDGTSWFSGRATSVVIAVGQFLHGLDVVPRGHPGDGRAEVQVYTLAPRERALMRSRLGSGTHVPHPRIRQRTGRRVEVSSRRRFRVEADGDRGHAQRVAVEVVPEAYRLLI